MSVLHLLPVDCTAGAGKSALLYVITFLDSSRSLMKLTRSMIIQDVKGMHSAELAKIV